MNDEYREKPATSALLVTNVILGSFILLIIGVSVYFESFYQSEINPQAAQPYVSVARERLQRHSETISTEAAGIAEEIGPPIVDAVYAQVAEDYPRYIRTFKSEGQEYLGNVEQEFMKQVKARYAGYLRRHRNIVKEEFPEHASDENVEAVLADFEQTFDRLVKRYYLDKFRQQADRTVSLWKEVKPVPMPGPDQPSLNEQLADYASDWAVLAFADQVDEQLTSAGPLNARTTQVERLPVETRPTRKEE
ncbi:hypothetical protein ETAA8_37690 [Anatilimnocola aggregata]|uniref:Uncharacterized protein n=1 Tax=Anatilimnocola aggregata TaxID=2528021 RepID=A0A517YEJ9_9BACT|nr:hypothetical protein [Anatilimnocola aggregata]QDU28666.1 hypothetical protein ETAA8_37690 [Anatilimnocola aggregata]